MSVIAVGSRVTLVNLVQMPHLNGMQGTVIVWLEDTKRWQVQIDTYTGLGGIQCLLVQKSDGKYLVLPENLVLVESTGVGEVVGDEIAVDEALAEELSRVKELRRVKQRRVNFSGEEDAGTDAVEALQQQQELSQLLPKLMLSQLQR